MLKHLMILIVDMNSDNHYLYYSTTVLTLLFFAENVRRNILQNLSNGGNFHDGNQIPLIVSH